MIKIHGIKIEDPTEPEGLAALVEGIIEPDSSTEYAAERLFGLLTILQNANRDERSVIIERAQYFTYTHTGKGREEMEAMRKAILDS
jgi:hypothetical protein